MSSFEWMELQTLTSDITAARSRLAAARAKKDSRLTRALEDEITAAEDRRTRLLSNITDQLSGDAEQFAAAAASDGTVGEPAALSDEELAAPFAEAAAAPPEPAIAAAPAPVAPPPPRKEAAAVAWDRLAPGDIARAKDALRTRRADLLARHAAALKELQVDRIKVEALDQAIDAFTRKFAAGATRGAVVQLDEEREMRAQNRA